MIFGDFSKVLKLVDGFNGLILFSRLSTSTGTTSLSKDDENEAFNRCTRDALVVSEVFCLPSDYRKDVPPPSKKKFLKSEFQFIKSFPLFQSMMGPFPCTLKFPSVK